jgi:hypothetical protein
MPRFIFQRTQQTKRRIKVGIFAGIHGDEPEAVLGLVETLRVPPENGKRDFKRRKESPTRPVVFSAPNEIDDDVVQLHLSHRVAQRLLGWFLAQGFVHHDLSRACLPDAIITHNYVLILVLGGIGGLIIGGLIHGWKLHI